MTAHAEDPVAALVEHMQECRGAQGAIVMHRPEESSDPVVAGLLAEGWTWSFGTEAASTEVINGKRIRYLNRPPE